MLNSIDVKFIFDSAYLGLFSSAINILHQVADVALQIALSSCCSCRVFSYYFA